MDKMHIVSSNLKTHPYNLTSCHLHYHFNHFTLASTYPAQLLCTRSRHSTLSACTYIYCTLHSTTHNCMPSVPLASFFRLAPTMQSICLVICIWWAWVVREEGWSDIECPTPYITTLPGLSTDITWCKVILALWWDCKAPLLNTYKWPITNSQSTSLQKEVMVTIDTRPYL